MENKQFAPLGASSGVGDVAAFLADGQSVVVYGAHLDTISFFVQDDVRFLRVSNGVRTWVIPNVQYWTEDNS